MVPPELAEPLPPLPAAQSSNCADLLGNYMDTLSTCAIWGARYQSLIEAVKRD